MRRVSTLMVVAVMVGLVGAAIPALPAAAVVPNNVNQNLGGPAAPTIFAVSLRNCQSLHVGYNRFPNATVIHWRVNQTGTHTLASGTITAIGGGTHGSKTYHFVTVPLGVTLQPDSATTHTHVRFVWTIGTTETNYVVTRDPGCIGLRWTSPPVIQPFVASHYASIDPCPSGTTGVFVSIFFTGGVSTRGPFALGSNDSWSANFAYLGDIFPSTGVSATCQGPNPNAPPLATYETHPITITP